MGRTRGLIWLLAGIFMAIVAGLLAWQYLDRATVTSQEEFPPGVTTTVVVVARDVPVRTQLVAADLRLADYSAASLPAGALSSLDEAVGKITTGDQFEGELVLSHRLLDPTVISPDGRLALLMVEDQILMAIPALEIMSRVHVLKPGDRVDVLVSLDFDVKTGGLDGESENVQVTFIVLQNISVAGLTGSIYSPKVTSSTGANALVEDAAADVAAPVVPDAVLLTLTPQDALALKHSMDAGGIIDLVLRAPGVDRPWQTDAVDADYLKSRYDLPLEPGR